MAKGSITSVRSINVLATAGVNLNTKGCQVYRYYCYNVGAATVYLKFYDKSTAPSSSDTPIETWPLPAGGGANAAADSPLLSFTNGLGVRATANLTDSDNTDPAASSVIVDFGIRSA